MADAGYLTIGKVVRRLQEQYPDLSVSKIRYLEDEGLLDPSRTPGGYRLYSPKDIRRLESILFLQKTRFLPLSVIKDELDAADSGSPSPSGALSQGPAASPVPMDDEETVNKFHPIEHAPELLGVSVSFIQQLAEVGVISLKRSPHGRDLVDGHDFELIRLADSLRRYGFEPRNLRQYVIAANRESATFEQALVSFSHRQGVTPEERQREYAQAFEQIVGLTNTLRTTLIKRALRDSSGSKA